MWSNNPREIKIRRRENAKATRGKLAWTARIPRVNWIKAGIWGILIAAYRPFIKRYTVFHLLGRVEEREWRDESISRDEFSITTIRFETRESLLTRRTRMQRRNIKFSYAAFKIVSISFFSLAKIRAPIQKR